MWYNTLRFLPPSTHGTCDTCLDAKQAFRNAREIWKQIIFLNKTQEPDKIFFKQSANPKDAQTRFEVARNYKSHIDAVKADRRLEDYLQAHWCCCIAVK